MCVVSMIGDHYNEKWNAKPWQTVTAVPVDRHEFDALKAEVLEMKELLKKAVEYDKRTGQPQCENDEKLALLRKIAAAVGVSLDDVL